MLWKHQLHDNSVYALLAGTHPPGSNDQIVQGELDLRGCGFISVLQGKFSKFAVILYVLSSSRLNYKIALGRKRSSGTVLVMRGNISFCKGYRVSTVGLDINIIRNYI
jgi:hypothetical protein